MDDDVGSGFEYLSKLLSHLLGIGEGKIVAGALIDTDQNSPLPGNPVDHSHPPIE